ncbi:ABC transporter permease subunit [Modestobacter sp. I12A-02628]|uniref:ABC transporter permease subunit n=1 Tax=Goekera deserti TaxID=2497753 RepID=A0A7K3WEN7_9ACTN|nr:ABC transporter permease subunit [Goekera deserti]MPQ98106.1 ABC transporter permease subunit [Goekera deserti]NDI48754.1 ABC transporter permease subunit [Goekera deserti]NEL54867.1 ABC transporter permease subunit [Goekera deserti]
MTAVLERPPPAPAPEPPAPRRTARLPRRALAVAAVLLAWVLLGALLRGRQTLALGPAELSPLHRGLSEVTDSIGAGRATNPLFTHGFDVVRQVVDAVVTLFQDVIAQPSFGRPVPVLGWLGVVAVAVLLAALAASWRVALLTGAGLVTVGLQGLWTESMETLALTLAAVLVCLLIGIPLGIWAGVSHRVHRVLTPVLDVMQTMPSLVYLAPLTLVFLIGPASATIATIVYAVPPVIRLTAAGVREAPAGVVEAARSVGADRWQTLRTVRLPLARQLVVTGVNQTIMAALSMATIAALINAPGLGQTVLQALETLDVGTAFNAGLAIVVLAVLLDRATSAASARVARRRGAPARGPWGRAAVGAGVVLTLVAVWFSRTYVWAAQFPAEASVGPRIADAADAVSAWAQTNLSALTLEFKDAATESVLNPLQTLLTDSPWWVTGGALVALAGLAGGRRAVVAAVVCLGLLIALGLWEDSMTTLASTLVATVLTLSLGVTAGVAMGRSARVDAAVRPFLDAAQSMPPFVYLVPFLALFAASRFTAILAAVVYAVPVTTKIVADGIRAVPVETVEAATSAGSTRWQVVTKVQLPMSRHALALAANQGLIYVLAMVVVGGLVGAGALGYDVVAGFSQSTLYGKGLAAGASIVLLGVLLDRVTQAAAARTRAPA